MSFVFPPFPRLFFMQKALAETLDSLREVVASVDYLVATDGSLGKVGSFRIFTVDWVKWVLITDILVDTAV